jgi:hypothetical protein
MEDSSNGQGGEFKLALLAAVVIDLLHIVLRLALGLPPL